MRVYIVGVAARSFEWEKPCEVWVINHAGVTYPQDSYDRWFHLHGPEHVFVQKAWSEPDTYRTVDSSIRPVYVPNVDVWKRRIPLAEKLVAFPYIPIVQQFGNHFDNSFPLLIGFAILEGATEIVLDGVQFGIDKPAEAWAIPNISYMLGVAAGRGIKVRVPKASGILPDAHVYGLEGPGSI